MIYFQYSVSIYNSTVFRFRKHQEIYISKVRKVGYTIVSHLSDSVVFADLIYLLNSTTRVNTNLFCTSLPTRTGVAVADSQKKGREK